MLLGSLSSAKAGPPLAWGYSHYGQLGDGTTTNQVLPVAVSGITGVLSISDGYEHSLALKTDGTVWVCGDNHFGQLGNTTNNGNDTPIFTPTR